MNYCLCYISVKMRRIAESEKPLVLALTWSREKNCNKMFVLQENETGDILVWDCRILYFTLMKNIHLNYECTYTFALHLVMKDYDCLDKFCSYAMHIITEFKT
jgi:hypothetical protein